MIDDPVRDEIYEPPYNQVDAARNRNWTSWTVMFAVVLMMFANARALERWAAVQPPGWWTETARLMADLWTERMGLAGFTEPRERMADGWTELKAIDWEDLWPAEESDEVGTDPAAR
jgi:hypothetical protein